MRIPDTPQTPRTPPTLQPSLETPDLTEAMRRFEQALISLYLAELLRYLQRTAGVNGWSEGLDASLRGQTNAANRTVWRRVAVLCIRRQLHPEWLIGALFSSWTRPEFPQPNQLLSARTLELYQGYAVNLRRHLSSYFRSQLERITAELHVRTRHAQPADVAKVQAMVLMENLLHHPLAVFLTAQVRGIRRMIDLSLQPAALEYLRHRTLWDELLSHHLPDDFKEYARQYAYPEVADGESADAQSGA